MTDDQLACQRSVGQAMKSAAYLAATSREKVKGNFFSCSGGLATVEPSNDAADIATIVFDDRTQKAVDVTGLPSPARALAVRNIRSSKSPESAQAGSGNDGSVQGFSGTIKSQYVEKLQWQIVYGYSGDEYPQFTSTIQNTLTLNLGYANYQQISLSWTNLQNREISPSTITELRLENGYAPSSEVQRKALGSGEGGGNVYRTSYTEGSTLGPTPYDNNYSLQQITYDWNDRTAEPGGHQFSIDQIIGNGHRWQCIGTRTCEFPYGEEAPILG